MQELINELQLQSVEHGVDYAVMLKFDRWHLICDKQHHEVVVYRALLLDIEFDTVTVVRT